MGLFGPSKEKREQKALEHFLAAPSVDAGQVEALKHECQNAGGVLHGVLTQSHDSDHRFRALIGLNMLGITADMVPAIIAALNDPDDMVEEAAAKIVSTHRQFAGSFIPALLEAYHQHPQTQYTVLQALGDYGPEARAAGDAILPDLMQPTHALPVARCLSHIGAELDPLQQGFVDLLSERRKPAELAPLGSSMVAMLESFLLSCVPWKCVDAIPAWRRALEAYTEVCDRPAPALVPVLTELTQFTDWKLRGQVGDQYLEMSRAKVVADALLKRATT